MSRISMTRSTERGGSWLVRGLRWFLKLIPWLVGAGLVALLLYIAVVRPWHLRWGATDAELKQALPGDELITSPTSSSTRAITIKAPPDKVWPWIIQMGYKRAGWYTYDWLEYLMGCADFVDGWRSAQRIVPELQGLKVGDEIAMHPAIPPYKVVTLVPNRSMVLQVGDLAEPSGSGTMAFYLEPGDGQTTRLIVRSLGGYSDRATKIVFDILEPGIFIMESGMISGIRRVAEAPVR